jgi:hypothetical protein
MENNGYTVILLNGCVCVCVKREEFEKQNTPTHNHLAM